MKRIVILSAFLSPLRSGAEACAEEVALELCDQFDITIVTAKLRRDLPREDMLQGKVRIVRVGFGCVLDKLIYPLLASRKARSIQPDIVHAVLESYAGLAMMLIGPGPKKILTCQSTNTSLFLHSMHKSADIVTVISKALQKRAEHFGREDAVLIPNGLRLHQIPQQEKIVGRILFAGRLEHMKGVDVLLEAMQNLPPRAHLHIVGDGSLRAELEAKAQLLGLGTKVTFLGFIPVPDVYKEFAAAQVFCGLSRSEAFGNVFLEAQAAECGVIGTSVGGIPDIVEDGTTGLLVPPNNPEAAHIALSQLLEDEALRSSLARTAKEHAQKYDWSAIAKQYAAVYG